MPVELLNPTPAPCTVTHADPVPAVFPLRITLMAVASTDHASLTLPALCPMDKTVRFVPPPPPPVRHLTHVSEPHPVASHPDLPNRDLAVPPASPKPIPCKVTDAEPVPMRFTRLAALSLAASTDHPWLKLPTRATTVITALRVPVAPWPTLHPTDVSEPQIVDSHPVRPERAPPECTYPPIPPPSTVIKAEPVPARFTVRTTLRPAPSNDQPCVTLPARPPSVRAMRRDPALPPPTRHGIDVSEYQLVISHFVDPALVTAVVCVAPMFDP